MVRGIYLFQFVRPPACSYVNRQIPVSITPTICFIFGLERTSREKVYKISYDVPIKYEPNDLIRHFHPFGIPEAIFHATIFVFDVVVSSCDLNSGFFLDS